MSSMAADHVFALAAFVYRPIPAVEIMPNVRATFTDGAEAEVEGRLTLHARF